MIKLREKLTPGAWILIWFLKKNLEFFESRIENGTSGALSEYFMKRLSQGRQRIEIGIISGIKLWSSKVLNNKEPRF